MTYLIVATIEIPNNMAVPGSCVTEAFSAFTEDTGINLNLNIIAIKPIAEDE